MLPSSIALSKNILSFDNSYALNKPPRILMLTSNNDTLQSQDSKFKEVLTQSLAISNSDFMSNNHNVSNESMIVDPIYNQFRPVYINLTLEIGISSSSPHAYFL